MTIAFGAYTAPSATGNGALPKLRGYARSTAASGAVGHGRLPGLKGYAQNVVVVAPGTPATGNGRLPRLRGWAHTASGAVQLARLPTLLGSATRGTDGRAALPPLRAYATTRGGTRGLGRLPQLKGYASASMEMAPSVSLGIAALPMLRSSGGGTAFYPASQDAALPELKTFAHTASGAAQFAKLPQLKSYAYTTPTLDNWAMLVQSAGVMQITVTGTPAMQIIEGLELSGSASADWIQSLQDRLRVTSTPLALLDALARVSETLTFKDMVSIAYAMLVQESVSIGGSPTASLRHALQLADALTLISGTGSALDAQVTVATAFALADSLASVYPNALAENVDLSGTVAATLRATLQLLDAMRVQDGVTPGMTWLVQTDETFELTDANATIATLGMLLADGIEMLGELRFEDGAYLAWVVNTETRAFVKYRNFPFNSFARIGDSYFGCGADGIYELAGDDDAGEPITAVLRGGLTDLGSSLLKNMPAAYIGYRAADQMVLKVTVMTVQKNGDIERQEHWYRMEPRQANAIRENRVKLGRGLKSTYWGWELTNINGADFDVDSFSWYPVVLERRLN